MYSKGSNIKIIDSLKRNKYLWQIITLLSGSLLAQVILFAFIPIVTRIYTPSEFGLYSIFFSIAMAIGMVSSLRYEQAIVLPKSNRDAQALLFISTLVLLVVVFLTSIVVFIFYDWFVELFQQKSYLVWLMPISVFIIGLGQIFESYSTRKEFYQDMSKAKIAVATSTVTTQISSRHLFSLNGLITGKIFSDLVGILILLRAHFKNQTLNLKALSKRRVFANMKRHDHFPKYQSGTTLVNYLSQNLPILLFPIFFSAEVVGYYALTFRVLMTPTTILTSSVRSVYYQRASKMFANNKEIRPLFLKTTAGLVKLYAIPFFIIIIYGEDIFRILFGDEWSNAGKIAQVMIFISFFSFINPPSTMTFNILNIQKIQLYIQIVQLFLRALALFIGYYFYDSYMISIGLYIAVGVGANIFQILYIDRKLSTLKQ